VHRHLAKSLWFRRGPEGCKSLDDLRATTINFFRYRCADLDQREVEMRRVAGAFGLPNEALAKLGALLRKHPDLRRCADNQFAHITVHANLVGNIKSVEADVDTNGISS
jgi:hypothetical protein